MADVDDLKKGVFDYVRNRLGGGIVEVELEPEHYETGLEHAVDTFRQKSTSAMEEAYAFLETEKDKNIYQLPPETQEVRQIFRRGLGSEVSGGTTNFDPFELAYTNIYLLQSGGTGGLATYDLYSQYQELAQRMLGGYLNYDFNRVSKKLRIIRNFRSSTTLLLWVYIQVPIVTLLSDVKKAAWLKKWTLASCKQMLGEARSKYAVIAGPQGGTSLNGDALKAEASAEMEMLEQELRDFVAGDQEAWWFTIG